MDCLSKRGRNGERRSDDRLTAVDQTNRQDQQKGSASAICSPATAGPQQRMAEAGVEPEARAAGPVSG